MSLHIFDMDGTLLRGTTAGMQIARHAGVTEELVELEARFAALLAPSASTSGIPGSGGQDRG